MYPDELTTERLRLRTLRLDDAPVLHERILADPRVSRYLTWRPTSSLQEATDRLAGILDEEQKRASRTWSILPAGQPDDPIGTFTVWTTEHGQELGYCLTPEASGGG